MIGIIGTRRKEDLGLKMRNCKSSSRDMGVRKKRKK